MTTAGSRHLDFPLSNRESSTSNSISINEIRFHEEVPDYPIRQKKKYQHANLTAQSQNGENFTPTRKIKRNKQALQTYDKENQSNLPNQNMTLNHIEICVIDDDENAQNISHRKPKSQARKAFEEPDPYKMVQVDTSIKLESNQPRQIVEKPVKSRRPKNPIRGRGIGTILDPTISGLEKLNILSSIFVKQKFEMLEMLTGCDSENRYKVYAADKGLERIGKPIFKCKERSGCLARNCLRPFQMRVTHEDGEEDNETRDTVLLLDRPCTCSFCCINRPEILVTLKERGVNKYIGKVVSEWTCCDMIFSIFDFDSEPVYKIYGSSCQCSLYCNCPRDSCSKVVFNIRSPEGEIVGQIYKLYSGASLEIPTDTDNFCCVFPSNCSAENKALLLSAVLFIDFKYFEQSPTQNNNFI